MSVVPITNPPILVDSTAVQFFFGLNKFAGPFQIGTDLYVALSMIDGIGTRVEVVQSTDGGSTWARLDDGGGTSILINGVCPLFTSTEILWFFGGVFPFDTFSANYEDAQVFDISTGLFGPLIASDGGSQYDGSMVAVRRSDGTVVLTFEDGIGTEGRIYSAGVLGAPFTVEVGSPPLGNLIDASDVVHVIVQDAGTAFNYYTVTGAGTVSGPANVGEIVQFFDQGVADGGNLAFPFINNLGPFPRAKLVYATGASSSPGTASWTQYAVWTSGLDADSVDQNSFAVMDGSDLLVFWINKTSTSQNRVYYAKFNGGGFDTPVLFYDSVADPPAGATMDPNMIGISVAKIGGAWVGIAGMNIDGSGFQTFYLTNGTVQSGYRNRLY